MKYIVLNKNKDFVSLYKRGKYVAGKHCVVYYRKNGSGENRMGITTGKKCGNAVERSRCRRIIRQAYSENYNIFPNGFDIVICGRDGCSEAKSTQISSFLKARAIPAMINFGSNNNNHHQKDNGRNKSNTKSKPNN